MIRLPSTPRTFFDLVGLSVRHHFSVFRRLFFLIVLVVVVKDAYIYLGGMPENTYLLALLGIVMALLVIFLAVFMLSLTQSVFQQEKTSWMRVLKSILPKLGKIYLAFVLFIVVPALLFLLGEWIVRLVVAHQDHRSQYAGLILILAVGIPVLFFYLRYFFAIPLMVMEDASFIDAFKRAGQLCSGKQNWLRVFGVYAGGVAIWLLVSPDTLHGHLMKMYKVSALFDFIVFVVTLPILMNLIVLVRNDLALRGQIQETDSTD